MRGLPTLLVAICFAALLTGACGDKRSEITGLGPSSSSNGGGGMGGGFTGMGGDCNIAGVCGNEIHEVLFNAPNVYFVLDKSGSMQQLDPVSGDTHFSIVRDAAIDLIKSLGSLINVGAAVFPLGTLCQPGDEVFETQPGEPLGPNGQESQMIGAFRKATNFQPIGGTPIASTLAAIEPIVTSLGGTTIVLLLTDGGPNCNPLITCSEATCMPHIEGVCTPGEDCCATDNMSYGPIACVDQQTTLDQIAGIKDAGIPVYTIGITGSAQYGAVLDAMAVAGGTDVDGSHHVVDDIATLSQVFGQIAASAISCEWPLSDPPDDPGLTNVYLDCDVVTFDPAQGWDWADDGTVRLNGASCAKLKSGAVGSVTIATGCPTELPK